MFGPIGDTAGIIAATAIVLWILMDAKKLSDVHLPAIFVAIFIGVVVGLTTALLTGSLPDNGSSAKCTNYEHRGRGLECVD